MNNINKRKAVNNENSATHLTEFIKTTNVNC